MNICECGHSEGDHLEGVCQCTIEVKQPLECFLVVDYCPCIKFKQVKNGEV